MVLHKAIRYNISIILFIFFLVFTSCNKEILEETPLSSLSSDIVLSSPKGFELYLVSLYDAAREELTMDDITYYTVNFGGTDMTSFAGEEHNQFKNYITYLTATSSEARNIWNWAYSSMILRANTIITFANKEELSSIWTSEEQKNTIIAEAKFFRAYTYNLLANLYGGVPIVDAIYTSPKFDFQRASREEVFNFAREDLEFATEWLPDLRNNGNEGKIVKAAAQHLLTEVYISLEEYQKAIESASEIINSELYNLMTDRFGGRSDLPGDVFSDLFVDGNQSRSSGNMETIYYWRFESFTPGGGGSNNGNNTIRSWAPFLTRLSDPSGYSMVVTDSLGRGVGRLRGSNYYSYDIWRGDWENDIRNSVYNMRRDFYYNNPASPYFGELVEPKTAYDDTMRNIYPYSRKVEGNPWNNNPNSGKTDNNFIVYRLAETYLLRAEAYFKLGNSTDAADDINVIRLRANARSIEPADVNLDFILDERARELATEEPRRRTLIRMGKHVERVKKYCLLEITRNSIQEHHEFFPIPQDAIDANLGSELQQNPGY